MRSTLRFLAVAATGLAAACGGGGDSTSPKGTTGTPSTPVIPSTPSAPVATNSVSIADDTFSPANIQVSPNTTVTWTWTTGTLHNVTFTDGTGSGDKGGNNASFSKTFSTAGTFNYSCTLHAGMNGSVTVK